ncbi:hypothetical protein ACFSQ7_37975 [Paenibacillus rhizoplanae]
MRDMDTGTMSMEIMSTDMCIIAMRNMDIAGMVIMSMGSTSARITSMMNMGTRNTRTGITAMGSMGGMSGMM